MPKIVLVAKQTAIETAQAVTLLIQSAAEMQTVDPVDLHKLAADAKKLILDAKKDFPKPYSHYPKWDVTVDEKNQSVQANMPCDVTDALEFLRRSETGNWCEILEGYTDPRTPEKMVGDCTLLFADGIRIIYKDGEVKIQRIG